MRNKSNLAALLTEWYRHVRRPLPWRSQPTPYRVWVAEVMSQQTTLKVVVPRFIEFIEALPDLAALAKADEETLRGLWAGLGYYARARNLKKGARLMAIDACGQFPATTAEWRRIPGCGPYTAAVIASICFGEKEPAIDGNVIRVVSRLYTLQDSGWTQKGRAQIAKLLKEQIALCSNPGDFNQAMMELGQEVCKKKRAACPICPLKCACLAFARGVVDQFPQPKPRPKAIGVKIAVLVLSDIKSGKVVVSKRLNGFLKETVGFPLVGEGTRESREVMLFLKRLKAEGLAEEAGHFKHVITRHNLDCKVVDVAFPRPLRKTELRKFERILNCAEAKWIEFATLYERLSSSLDRKALKSVLTRRELYKETGKHKEGRNDEQNQSRAQTN